MTLILQHNDAANCCCCYKYSYHMFKPLTVMSIIEILELTPCNVNECVYYCNRLLRKCVLKPRNDVFCFSGSFFLKSVRFFEWIFGQIYTTSLSQRIVKISLENNGTNNNINAVIKLFLRNPKKASHTGELTFVGCLFLLSVVSPDNSSFLHLFNL